MSATHRKISPDRLARLDELDPAGNEFLAASAHHALATLGRERRRRTTTIAALAVLLVLSAVFGSLAGCKRSANSDPQTRRNAPLAALDLVTLADAARDCDRTLALQLGVAASAVSPAAETATHFPRERATPRG